MGDGAGTGPTDSTAGEASAQESSGDTEHSEEPSDRERARTLLRQKVWTVLAQVAVVGGGALLLWYALDIVLLIFAGILLAVFLNAPAEWISEEKFLTYRWAVLLISLLLVLLVGLFVWWQGPRVAEDLDRLAGEVPTSMEELRTEISRTSWGDEFLVFLPSAEDSGENSSQQEEGGQQSGAEVEGGGDGQGTQTGDAAADAAQRIFSSVATGVLNTFVVVFLGIYFALAPDAYRQAVVRLFPPGHRRVPNRALLSVGSALRSWILGRASAMLLTMLLVAVGLLLLGIPLVLTLALFAGIMNFVPYIGPVFAALPAVALAWGQSVQLALWVALFYWGVQIVESFIATPLIQKKAVSTPPALLIVSQIFMGLVAGFLGVLVATPLAVAVVVLVQTLYMEDTLDEEVDVLGT